MRQTRRDGTPPRNPQKPTPRTHQKDKTRHEIRVGIIGCGRSRQQAGATGYGMAHAHAAGYEAHPRARIVALADINLENAAAFQQEHGGERTYASYAEMLAQEQLDMVSVCLWPHLHAPAVIAAAEAGVRAIHCEKPMAPTFGEARAMVDACDAHGTQLTFNHQRRFAEPFRAARALLDAGPSARCAPGGHLQQPVRFGAALV